jgi:hypothetical protein
MRGPAGGNIFDNAQSPCWGCRAQTIRASLAGGSQTIRMQFHCCDFLAEAAGARSWERRDGKKGCTLSVIAFARHAPLDRIMPSMFCGVRSVAPVRLGLSDCHAAGRHRQEGQQPDLAPR